MSKFENTALMCITLVSLSFQPKHLYTVHWSVCSMHLTTKLLANWWKNSTRHWSKQSQTPTGSNWSNSWDFTLNSSTPTWFCLRLFATCWTICCQWWISLISFASAWIVWFTSFWQRFLGVERNWVNVVLQTWIRFSKRLKFICNAEEISLFWTSWSSIMAFNMILQRKM